ncbi:MAG: FkbM family methyltransferase [Saprospiraceae bacterium]|nr:FkbM family methyltransferase [Saprospiraceae bacterium]
MLNYLKNSFRRKIARRFTREYPTIPYSIQTEKYGTIEFSNWDNPLVSRVELDTNMIDFFGQFIKEGDLAIDIGANIGDTTVPMGFCAGKSGLVLGFDPNPYVYKVLVANAALNKDKTNIIPVPYAISQQEEEFYFISSEASFSNGGISKTRESHHGKYVYPSRIKGVRLIDYLEQNYKDRLSRFSFIKIDTEGYDKEIIKSIKDLLLKYKPVIVAESFGAATEPDKLELYDVISSLGYTLHYFSDFKDNAEVIKLNSRNDILNYKRTINIYAIPN